MAENGGRSVARTWRDASGVLHVELTPAAARALMATGALPLGSGPTLEESGALAKLATSLEKALPASQLDNVALWRLEKVVLDQTAAMQKIADAVAATLDRLGDAVAALTKAAERPITVKVRPSIAATLSVPKTRKRITRNALDQVESIVTEPEP